MHWTSEAIIIKQQNFDDDKLLCWLLSEAHGIYKGLISLNKKTRSQIQIGNIVNATWKARLENHLGSYYCELLKPLPMAVINNKLKLSSVISLCSLLSTTLPERAIETKIYEASLSYLLTLKEYSKWLIEYLKLELILLQEMGYRLELDVCAVTKSKENLYYVSPNTGKAVTKEVGAAYHDKLLLLPAFFRGEEEGNIIDGFKLTGFFLNKYLYNPEGKTLPDARVRFAELIIAE